MISRYKYKTVSDSIRPALIGLLTALAVTVLLIAIFSLVFVMIEKIAESAIVPLALISAAIGCFAGAFVCSAISQCRGVVCGLIVSLVMFSAIWVAGIFGSDTVFGTDILVKLIILLFAGLSGGWVGKNRKFNR